MIYENLGNFISRITCFSSFVDTAQCFPKPLSKEEESQALKQLKQGDKAARDKLITHNLRLVAHIVKKFPNSLEADDLISVGTIGLIKAVDTYDESKNVKLSTYASRCITNEILMLIRANKRHKDVISLSSILSSDHDDTELELEKTISAEERLNLIEQVEKNLIVDRVKKVASEKLTDVEREIIIQRYALNGGGFKSQGEVAKKLGISRSYVSRLETSAIKTLKENLASDEFDQDN